MAMSTKSLKEYRKKLLADPEVKTAYDALEDEYALARAIIQARITSGLTQEELAKRMDTTQSVIARLESGKALPSTRTLLRVAKATGTHFRAQFVAD
jgi:ribosome-binding protein aMBF1 (putative translation factor)